MAFCYKKVIQYSASFTIHAARVFPIFANKVLHLKKLSFANILYRALSGDAYSIIHESFESNPHFGQKTNCISGETIFCDENELVCIWVIIQRNIHLRPTIAVAIFSVFWWHEDQKTELCISSSKSNLRYFFQVDAAVSRDFLPFFSKRTSFSRIIAQNKHRKKYRHVYFCNLILHTQPFLFTVHGRSCTSAPKLWQRLRRRPRGRDRPRSRWCCDNDVIADVGTSASAGEMAASPDQPCCSCVIHAKRAPCNIQHLDYNYRGDFEILHASNYNTVNTKTSFISEDDDYFLSLSKDRRFLTPIPVSEL